MSDETNMPPPAEEPKGFPVPPGPFQNLLAAYNKKEEILLRVGELAIAHLQAVNALAMANQEFERQAAASFAAAAGPGQQRGQWRLDITPDGALFRRAVQG